MLFDLDGVLIDSSQCITLRWQVWADRHGLDIEQITQVAHGLRSGDTMRLVAPRGLDIEAEERQYMAVEVTDHEGVTVIEGAAQLRLPSICGSAIMCPGFLVKLRGVKAEFAAAN